MLTPKFSLSQNDAHLFIHIHAPFIKLDEAESYVTGDEFYFHAQPYYLRLHLPGEVLDGDGHAGDSHFHSKYDVDSGQLSIRLLKKCHGEHFEGLDMLTKLLTPKSSKSPLSCNVEVISSSSCDKSTESEHAQFEGNHERDDKYNSDEDDFEFDWFIEQNVKEEENLAGIISSKYGFSNRRSNVLRDILSVNPAMLDIKNPDDVADSQRRSMRLHQEQDSFNCEHYLADFFEQDIIEDILKFELKELTCEQLSFSEKEQDRLTQLPRREYIIEKSELKMVYLGLIDLVYAYCFNYRCTNGGDCVESDWNICKLSATLSWLDAFENIKDVLISCARRSLCFPLYRNWNLFLRVLEDVKSVFRAGKPNILRCLLGIHSVLQQSESHYALNDLYVTDYCVWLQRAESHQIKSITDALMNAEISKKDMDLRLEEMEGEAQALMTEESDEEEKIDQLSTTMSNVVKIKDGQDSDDNSSSEESEDSESGSNSESEREEESKVIDKS